MVFAAFPVQVSAQFTGDPIYIGLVGPKGLIQWNGIKEGAELARNLINDAGGMVDSEGKTHEVLFVEIDESIPWVPRPSWDGVEELLAALDAYPTMQFLIGGFFGECVLPMREAAMDYAAVKGRPIWIITGASNDELIDDGPRKDNPYDDVREDYERYKYMFRSSFNTTTYLNALVAFLRDQVLPQKLVPLYGSPVKTYIIAEDLFWCDGIVEGLQGGALGTQANIVGIGRPSAIELDFAPFLDMIEDSGAKLIIHIFSTVAGPYFIWKWGERKVPAVPVGINFESGERLVYWNEAGWECEYETTLCVGARTNINPDAKPLSAEAFWDEYRARYGHAPIYTAWGAYDAIIALNETAAQWIGKNCSWIIPNVMEPTSRDSLLGHFKYTDYHDVYCDQFSMTPVWPPAGWPCTPTSTIGTVRPLVAQWQVGRLEVVWPRGYKPAPGSESPEVLWDPTPLPFAMKWKVPPWMYSLAETDFAGGPIIPSPPMAVDGMPTGFFGYFTSPDGTVGTHDMGAVTDNWQQTPPWTLLEADMDGNNFIDIYDVARVALDWGKTATPQ